MIPSLRLEICNITELTNQIKIKLKVFIRYKISKSNLRKTIMDFLGIGHLNNLLFL